MQVNDLVKVTNPDLEHDGQAGIVQANDEKAGTSTVKLDLEAEPLVFADKDLTFLGR